MQRQLREPAPFLDTCLLSAHAETLALLSGRAQAGNTVLMPTGSMHRQAQQLLSSPLSLLPAAGQEHRIIPPNKKTYQQDPANYREALREARLDEAEGADIMMVKPGLPYLDIIRLLRDNSTLPIAAYHVSGKLQRHRSHQDRAGGMDLLAQQGSQFAAVPAVHLICWTSLCCM